MAWTQADIDTLRAAIASGATRVSYSGPPARSIDYRSLAEMREILALMEGEVTPPAGGATTYRLAQWSKGFR